MLENIVAFALRHAKISKTILTIIILFSATFIILFIINMNALSSTKEELYMTQFAHNALVQGANILVAENDSLKQVNERINVQLNFSQAKQGELYHLLLKANRKIKKLQKEIDDIKASPSTSQIMDETDKAILMQKFWKVFGYKLNEVTQQQSYSAKSILPMSFFNTPLERPSEQDTSRDN